MPRAAAAKPPRSRSRLAAVVLAVIVVLAVMMVLGSCSGREPRGGSMEDAGGPTDASRSTVAAPRFRIALQFGLAYTPLAVVRMRGLVEDRLPDVEVEWIQLGNAAAIREAMLAGRLDVGFMGIPPFLIGADRGMPWKLFTGLCEAPLALVTRNPALRTLADFTPEHRIAVPQPGSIQHILLSMAAERDLGDPTRFDNQLLTLAHPDAMTALLAGSGVSAHFAPPPYVFEELAAPGAQSVISGAEAFGGPFTFIVGVASGEMAQSGDGLARLEALAGALGEAIGLLASPDASLIADLSGLYGLTPETLRAYLGAPGLRYTLDVQGLDRFAQAMHRFGYLTTPMEEVDTLTLRVVGSP